MTLAERIRAALVSRTDVEEKKMFGGLSFMVSGQMCCGVRKDDMIVRVEPGQFNELIAKPHVRPLVFSRRPMQGMVYVSERGLQKDVELRTWVQRGVDYIAAHPVSAKRRNRSNTSV